MDDFLSQQRIYDILQQKAAMGGLFPLDYDSLGGVLLGGARRKRKPSAFNKRVGAYARKHGVSAAVAAQALSGSKAAPKRRRRTTRKRGGASETSAILRALRQKERTSDEDYENQLIADYCKDIKPSNYKSLAEYKRVKAQCGITPASQRKLMRDLQLAKLSGVDVDDLIEQLKKKQVSV